MTVEFLKNTLVPLIMYRWRNNYYSDVAQLNDTRAAWEIIEACLDSRQES